MKKKVRPLVIRYIAIAVIIFGASVLISVLTRLLLVADYRFFSFTEEQAGLVASMIEGAVGAIAAGFVLYELKLNADVEVRQNDIEEAQFLLEYNQAFIQDEKMCTVEHLLECWMESDPSERVEPLINDDNRQQFINYLVYLEGLAPLVFRDILKLEHIDDLMAYRFFLAMNNKELQEDQLFRYADYYRGCFKLYAIWKTYRTKQNHPTPLSEYALDLWGEFEKYSEAPVSVRKLSLEDNLKKVAGLIYDTDPFIYPAAFGSRRYAMKMLPAMMEQKCIFHVDNVRIAEIEGTIVGIAVIINSSSYMAPPSLDSRKPSKGFVDVCENYFREIPEALSAVADSLHLACLCVDSSVRGQRVGEVLLKNVICQCREQNATAITLDVLEQNSVAIRLYRNFGFETISCGRGYSFGTVAPSCLRMMLNLNKNE